MQINFREWADLSADDRADSIHAAQLWLRGFPTLLLPCDITEACRQKIIGEAETLEQRRDDAEVAAWRCAAIAGALTRITPTAPMLMTSRAALPSAMSAER